MGKIKLYNRIFFYILVFVTMLTGHPCRKLMAAGIPGTPCDPIVCPHIIIPPIIAPPIVCPHIDCPHIRCPHIAIPQEPKEPKQPREPREPKEPRNPNEPIVNPNEPNNPNGITFAGGDPNTCGTAFPDDPNPQDVPNNISIQPEPDNPAAFPKMLPSRKVPDADSGDNQGDADQSRVG